MDDLRTLCLAGLLLLCLVLPLQASSAGLTSQKDSHLKLRIMWVGQICGSLCGLLLITSSYHPLVILAFAAVTTGFCFKRLQRGAFTS